MGAMRMLTLIAITVSLVFISTPASAQLDSERSMRNPSLAPRARVSGQSRVSGQTLQQVQVDRLKSGIERRERKNLAESRNLEYRTNLPRYSRERQQVADRQYKDFRDVGFIRSSIRNSDE